MINKVILIGRLGADPEIREISGGAKVANLRVATSENWRDKAGDWQEATEWHTVIAWRTLAEKAQSSLEEGDAVYIEGKLTHRTWQDKEGNNRKTTEVVASYFRVIQRRSGGEQTENDVARAAEKLIEKGFVVEDAKPGEVVPDDLPF